MEERTRVDKVVDLRGCDCTWFILKAKSTLSFMRSGEVLQVLGTDPLILQDFPAVLKQSGDELLKVDRETDFFRLYLHRGESGTGEGSCKDGRGLKKQ